MEQGLRFYDFKHISPDLTMSLKAVIIRGFKFTFFTFKNHFSLCVFLNYLSVWKSFYMLCTPWLITCNLLSLITIKTIVKNRFLNVNTQIDINSYTFNNKLQYWLELNCVKLFYKNVTSCYLVLTVLGVYTEHWRRSSPYNVGVIDYIYRFSICKISFLSVCCFFSFYLLSFTNDFLYSPHSIFSSSFSLSSVSFNPIFLVTFSVDHVVAGTNSVT